MRCARHVVEGSCQSQRLVSVLLCDVQRSRRPRAGGVAVLGGGDEVLVPLRDGVRVGQIGRRGKDHADVIDQSPIRRLASAAARTSRSAYSGLRREAGRAVGEPAVRVPLRNNSLRELRGGLGARPDFREVSFRDALEVPIDGLDPLPELLDLFLDPDDRRQPLLRARALGHGLYFADGVFHLTQALPLV